MKKSIKITLIFILLWPFFTLPVLTSQKKTTPQKEEKIKAGDVTLFVRSVGNPVTSQILITLNGGPGQSSHYMKSLEQLAGPNLTVVTFDQRGTGRSSEPTGGYSLQKYVEDIDAIRQHLKAEKLILFGHSFGGVLSLRYASLNPDRVSSLILMGSGPPALDVIGAAQMRLGQRLNQLVKDGILPKERPTEPMKMLKYMLPAYFSDPKFLVPEEITQSSFHAVANQKTYSDSGNWDFRPEMKDITCPVLFIWGEDDPFGLEMASETKKALINARLTDVILKKCGHFWHENMKDFFTHIKKFLKKQNIR